MTKQKFQTIATKHCLNKWNIDMNRLDSKLRTFKLFKKKIEQEPYLEQINDRHIIKVLGKFRMSCHKLNIETGRHKRPKTQIEDRVCHECNVLEDEIHFITECKLYTKEREELYSIFSNNTTSNNYTSKDKFIHIMSTKCNNQLLKLSNFIQTAFDIRKEKFL